MRRAWVGVVLGLFAFTAMSSGQASEELTLARAVEIALSAHPLLRATASGQDLAVAQLREAQAGWLPSLQVGETVTRSNNPVFVFGALLEQGQFGAGDFALDKLNDPSSRTNWRSYANLQAPIFSQLQTTTRVEQSRLGVRQAQAQHEGAAQQLRFEVIRAYYGVLVSEAIEAAARDSARTAEAELQRMRDRFQTGTVVESELLSMQVQWGEFRQRHIHAGGNVRVAYAALNTAMGLPIDTAVRLPPAMPEKRFTVADEGPLIEQALNNRPDYRHAQMEVQVKRQGARAARARYLPELNLFASVGNSAENFGASGSDYAFGANLSFNLFDGGRYPRFRQAQAAENMARARQDYQADQVRLEVVQTRQQFLVAQERLQVAADSVTQADEALRMIRDRYHSGLTAVTEALRAQAAQLQARSNLLSARYDYVVGYARLLLAVGALTDAHAFADPETRTP